MHFVKIIDSFLFVIIVTNLLICCNSKKKHNKGRKNKVLRHQSSYNQQPHNASGTTTANSPQQIQPSTNTIKILAFGDSLTEGMHENGMLFAPYSHKLEHLLNTNRNNQHYHVINDGISGQCVYPEMLTRLPLSLQKHHENLKLVVILGGTNDLRTLDCEKTINIAEEIIRLHKIVHDQGYKTIVVTIPEADERASLLPYPYQTYWKLWHSTNEKLRQYVKTESTKTFLCDLAKLFPMFSLHPYHKELYWSDELHPTKLGYEKMAKLLHKTIMKMNL